MLSKKPKHLEEKKHSFFDALLGLIEQKGDNDLPDSYTVDDQIRSLYGKNIDERCISSKGKVPTPIEHRIDITTIPSSMRSNKTPAAIIDELYEGYFDENFDPAYFILEQVSQWLEGSECNLNKRFMAEIESIDTDKDMILGKLATSIEKNQFAITDSEMYMFSIGQLIVKADSAINNSRLHLHSAQKIMQDGGIKVSTLQKRRSKFAMVESVVKNFKVLRDLSSSAHKLVISGDFCLSAHCVYHLILTTKNIFYDNFKLTSSMREGVVQLIPTIKRLTDKALDLITCRRFDSAQYENVVRTYMILDYMKDSMGITILRRARSSRPSSLVTPVTPLSPVNTSLQLEIDGLLEMASQIEKSQTVDVFDCIRSSILESIYVSHQHKAAFNNDFLLALPELEHEELYGCITSDILVNSVVRCCELLTEIVHTNFLISQWHRCPFNPKNRSMHYLHRSVSKMEEEFQLQFIEGMLEDHSKIIIGSEIGVEMRTPEKQSMPLSLNLTPPNEPMSLVNMDAINEEMLGPSSKPITQQKEMLEVVYKQLLDKKCRLWESIESSLLELLQTVAFSADIDLDDFCLMYTALHTFLDIGYEFCRASSSRLVSCIDTKTIEYFTLIHQDIFLTFRQMTDAEQWKCIDINLHGGILAIIKMKLSTSKAFALSRGKQNDLILSMFPTIGNPFCQMPTELPSTSTLLEFLSENDDDVPFSKEQEVPAVVTQSCLKGLTTFMGKYMQMMFIVNKPSVKIAVFKNLCQLFDYYVCSTLFAFSTSEQRVKMLYFAKNNAPPVENANDFQVLKQYVTNFLESSIHLYHDGPELKLADVLSTKSIFDIERTIDYSNIHSSRIFIDHAVNEHVVGVESCWFAARIMKDMKHKLLALLPDYYHNTCSKYIYELNQVVGQLQWFIYRCLCPALCLHNRVQINEFDRPSPAPHEKPTCSAWVDDLVKNCYEVWKTLDQENERSVVYKLAKEQIWMELCQASFDLSLNAFSKSKNANVPLMLINLTALQSALDSIHHCRPSRGKEHAEAFVKAFELSEDSVTQWIRDHFKFYSYSNLYMLIYTTTSKKKLKDAITALDFLYVQFDQQSFLQPFHTKLGRT